MTEPVAPSTPQAHVICAWCHKPIAYNRGHLDRIGICDPCYAKVAPKIRGVLTANSIASFQPGLPKHKRDRS